MPWVGLWCVIVAFREVYKQFVWQCCSSIVHRELRYNDLSFKELHYGTHKYNKSLSSHNLSSGGDITACIKFEN